MPINTSFQLYAIDRIKVMTVKTRNEMVTIGPASKALENLSMIF